MQDTVDITSFAKWNMKGSRFFLQTGAENSAFKKKLTGNYESCVRRQFFPQESTLFLQGEP